MQIEASTFNYTLSLIGGAVIALAGIFGVGNICLAMYQRWTSKQDKKDGIHETNRATELESLSAFQNRLLERVKKLEDDLEKMQDEELENVKLNTRLEIENQTCKEKIAAQQLQIERLEQSERDLKYQVQELTATVERLEKEMQAYRK